MNVVERHLIEAMALDDLQRQQRFARAWQVYFGESPKALKVHPGEMDDNVRVNYARLIVEKGISFLFGRELDFDLDETQRTPSETWLEDCWLANSKMLTLQKLALNGGVCGHAWAKIVPARSGARYPRIVVLDPANLSVGYAHDDIGHVEWYRIQYNAVDPFTARPMTVRQWIERDGDYAWQITDQESREGGGWMTTGEARWPYVWPPLVDCQNLPLPNEYWGQADLEGDLLDLSHSVDFVLSNLVRIIRFHAHPKTWGRGFETHQLKVAVDDTIVLNSPEAELHNLEMESDLASSLMLYDRLREALHELSRVPEVATGRVDRIGSLSGVALQILYQPLLEKTETKRRTYGEMLEVLNSRLLELGGWGAGLKTTLHWPEMLPGDPMVNRQVALLDAQLGVSDDTLLMQLGYDPDLERRKRANGDRETGELAYNAWERSEAEA